MLQWLLTARFKRPTQPYLEIDDFVCMVSSRLISLRKQGLWPHRVVPIKRIPDDTLVCYITSFNGIRLQVHKTGSRYIILREYCGQDATHVEVRTPFDMIRYVFDETQVDLRDFVIE